MNLNTDGLEGSIEIDSCDEEECRQCAAAVRSAGFCADFVCVVRDEEFRQFLAQLETALAKVGQGYDFDFRTLERSIGFKIHLDRRGHVDGKFEFGPDWRGPFLSGLFSADQTHLRAWANELRAALEKP